ncbi:MULTISPECIES: hypothetical protein [unclassified Paenibacillus]|nr:MULTISPECIES: hypothetical protein [unclassified Paenibacillus]MDQ0899351.1 hypothetical protein [Paenibacillus sp. V4I7]MDQ0914670.1 hypothetical protein [Paenibacillus sp. V4I5]
MRKVQSFSVPVMIGIIVYLKIEDIMVRNAYRANSVMEGYK